MATIDLPDLNAFARVLGIPKFVLTRYIFQANYYYKEFRIRKRSGHGYRKIAAPSRQLKGIQWWIMVFILRNTHLPDECMGFRVGRSIVHNAERHQGKRFVLNVDIKDFFPSISVKRVVGLFRAMGFSKDVAFGLGKLTTYCGQLPQGAPSSPDIANMICCNLDRRLRGYCAKRGWTYTRYCDDITISGNNDIYADAIANMVEGEGFELNNRKTRVMRRNSRQMVTGLVVNSGVNIPRYKRRTWRAIFHQADLEPTKFKHRIHELAGYAAFLKMVSPNNPHIYIYERVVSLVKSS